VLENFLESRPLQTFCESVRTAPSLLIEHVWDSPKALLTMLAQKASGKHVLIISGKKEDRFLDNFAFFHSQEILDFLPWETLPGEDIPPSPDITGKRIEILYKIKKEKGPFIVHCPLQALLQKTLSPETLIPKCIKWKKGEDIAFDQLPSLLSSLGYKRCPIAADKGEFAIRGGILDIFPMASSDPYRIDFFGDTIDQIRIYDPIGQKSIKKATEVFICPASEWALLKKETTPASLLDYLGKETIIIFDDLLAIEDQYVSLKSLPGIQTKLFFSLEEVVKQSQSFFHMFWSDHKIEELSSVAITEKKGRKFYSGESPLQELSFQFLDLSLTSHRWLHPFVEVSDFFCRFENKASGTIEEIFHGLHTHANSALRLHFVADSEAATRMIKEKLQAFHIELPKQTSFEPGYLSSGFVLPDVQIAYLPTTELTHRYKTRRQKWRNTYHTPASEFHQLTPGDIVVHFHNGIGKFLGIEKRPNHLGNDTEYMIIEYAESSKLYVPVAQSHLVSRYIGAQEEIPTLSSLGSPRWQKTCVQAQKSIIGYAKELLERTAQREIQGGFVYPSDSIEVQLFEEEFPFVETEDQLQAIQDIKKDMASSKAMDRLVCGDVGYGKTEVAMRAAFKAAVDGKKQVAVLVPTTILAMQHYETFKDRMSSFPIEVAVVSRFFSPKEIKETLKKVAAGTIDILIGTHRMISKDVVFKDLGLLIIDEEQRFGVRAKEHLKALKTGVDCLTLSATPIPRTLYMSLIGAREISVINTPPQDRLPIKSIIAENDSQVITNALLREFSRDGQAFFIHNRVESIFQITDQLQKLVPEAKIVTGHGQMSSDEIDAVFHAFKSGEADILVSTTIVENGIDIPNANTILIDRADQFGLADLYQLRGRVGRWNRPAYAYFLTPKNQRLSELSRKRLYALVESSGYGGGMKIAMRDLEIRGAGDILGVQQSGQISAIGFHLYCKLLKKTIDALKKKLPIHFIETKMEFGFDARLSEEYINESSLRMEIYYRLGNVSSPQEVNEMIEEMKDRFGPPPREVLLLCALTKIRVQASHMHITSIKFDQLTVTMEKQKGKNVIRKTFSLPSMKKLEDFETNMFNLLKQL
jgi:transcription-repair coupling factor (superfamily II helicase)